jgi:DNA-binding NarL/FixJ family response regulator
LVVAAIRVLVVDDNSEIRFLVRAALDARGGFEIVGEAGDGRAAVEQARRLQPDIVLLDLEMPAVGGLEALPQLADAAPEAKVIVLSGFRRSEYEQVVRAGGAVGYVEKGVTARRLVDEIVTLGGLVELVDAAVAEVRSRLAGEVTSVRAARRLVDETLRQWDCADALDEVVLLVSEVVTNAVTHGGSDVEVAVRLLPDALRFEVIDTGPAGAAAVTTTAAADDDESGRGLAIVEAMATRWGVESFDGGKSVWFEVPRLDSSGDVLIK